MKLRHAAALAFINWYDGPTEQTLKEVVESPTADSLDAAER
jgi:hypothetical protein